MAEFEGKLNLNVETSEIEIKGKFKLTEDELDKISGGNVDQSWREVLPGDAGSMYCNLYERKPQSSPMASISVCKSCTHLYTENDHHYCVLGHYPDRAGM